MTEAADRASVRAPALSAEQIAATARYLRGLGDPIRLRILLLLLEGECTVSRLADKLGLSQSRVSNHLACLRWCRFVESQRQGRNVVYRVNDPRLRQLLAFASELAGEHCEHLARCTRIGPDWI